MVFSEGLMSRMFEAKRAEETPEHRGETPFEVIGKNDEGRYVHEIVWAKTINDARKAVSRMHGVADAFALRAYELMKDAAGGVLYASNGRPIRNWE